ncbi:MAG: universal stress protein [Thermodesulfobacteriota bacterium]
MGISILFAVNESASSRAAINYLASLPFVPEEVYIRLVHVFRKPSSGEEMMGKKYMAEQADRYRGVLARAREQLVEGGFLEGNIGIELVAEPYDTISDGIMDVFKKGTYNMVVIGRKKMSKAEEFVLGDPSVKLVRALEGTAIVVIKS